MRNSVQARTNRRGVAMILVIVSVMMATVVATAYLASRDNSGAIGANVADSSSAKWAAESGVQLAVAVMQTETDWRANAAITGGTMIQNFSLGKAAVTISVKDLTNGMVPGELTEDVQIDSTAMVNGVQQTTRALAHVPLEPGTVADVDLSEFAVFVDSTLTQTNQSVIARWPMAPLTTLGRRILIGTRATAASSITLANSGAAIDATVFHGPGASNSLISRADGPDITTAALLDQMPFPAPPGHGETPNPLNLSDLTMNGGTATVTTSSRYRNIELRNNAVRTIRGNHNIIADNNFRINSGAKLIIDGSVKMVVFGNLELDNGAIELRPGARFRAYVRGATGGSTALSIKDSYIGDLRTNTTRDNTGRAVWMDPQRITLFSDAAVLGSPDWRIERNSVVKGSLYSPHASKVLIMETSALYGRIAAKAVEMRDDAALFYDPALDVRCGYSNPHSAVFDDNGYIRPEIRSLTGLDAASLQILADQAGITVRADVGTKTLAKPADALTGVPPVTIPNEPTPRPVRVDYDVISFGSSVKTWEQ